MIEHERLLSPKLIGSAVPMARAERVRNEQVAEMDGDADTQVTAHGADRYALEQRIKAAHAGLKTMEEQASLYAKAADRVVANYQKVEAAFRAAGSPMSGTLATTFANLRKAQHSYVDARRQYAEGVRVQGKQLRALQKSYCNGPQTAEGCSQPGGRCAPHGVPR